MNQNPAKRVVERLLSEARGDLRFDLNARVECWVTADDIEGSREYQQVVNNHELSEDAKIEKLKALAVQLAVERMSGVSEVEITSDVTFADVNVNRVDWVDLAKSDAERNAEDEVD